MKHCERGHETPINCKSALKTLQHKGNNIKTRRKIQNKLPFKVIWQKRKMELYEKYNHRIHFISGQRPTQNLAVKDLEVINERVVLKKHLVLI